MVATEALAEVRKAIKFYKSLVDLEEVLKVVADSETKLGVLNDEYNKISHSLTLAENSLYTVKGEHTKLIEQVNSHKSIAEEVLKEATTEANKQIDIAKSVAQGIILEANVKADALNKSLKDKYEEKRLLEVELVNLTTSIQKMRYDFNEEKNRLINKMSEV